MPTPPLYIGHTFASVFERKHYAHSIFCWTVMLQLGVIIWRLRQVYVWYNLWILRSKPINICVSKYWASYVTLRSANKNSPCRKLTYSWCLCIHTVWPFFATNSLKKNPLLAFALGTATYTCLRICLEDREMSHELREKKWCGPQYNFWLFKIRTSPVVLQLGIM